MHAAASTLLFFNTQNLLRSIWGEGVNGLSVLHAAKAEVRHTGVRRAAQAGAGAVVEAVADAAQERPPTLHMLGRPLGSVAYPSGKRRHGATHTWQNAPTTRRRGSAELGKNRPACPRMLAGVAQDATTGRR